jgi:CBS domain-containing protein
VRDIMTRKVIKTSPDEPVDIAARKLERHNISALPVVDETDRLLGMLTAIDLGKLFGGRWTR